MWLLFVVRKIILMLAIEVCTFSTELQNVIANVDRGDILEPVLHGVETFGKVIPYSVQCLTVLCSLFDRLLFFV